MWQAGGMQRMLLCEDYITTGGCCCITGCCLNAYAQALHLMF